MGQGSQIKRRLYTQNFSRKAEDDDTEGLDSPQASLPTSPRRGLWPLGQGTA